MNIEFKKSEQEIKIANTVIKQQRLAVIIKWINAGCGVSLVINGILRYIFVETLISQPWTIFQPSYMILFGLIILGSELNQIFILSRITFMTSYIGRGLLDIFVATICSSYLGDSGLSVLSIIITIILFIVGLMYLCFHFTGLELVLPQDIQDKLEGKKSSINTQSNQSLDNSQNLGRGLQESQRNP